MILYKIILQLVFIICPLIQLDGRQDILPVYPSMNLYTHAHTYIHTYIHTYLLTLCIPKIQNLVKVTT